MNFITKFASLLLSSCLIILILLSMSGCGAKKKAPEEAVELDPGQQRVADWHVLMREKRDVPEM